MRLCERHRSSGREARLRQDKKNCWLYTAGSTVSRLEIDADQASHGEALVEVSTRAMPVSSGLLSVFLWKTSRVGVRERCGRCGAINRNWLWCLSEQGRIRRVSLRCESTKTILKVYSVRDLRADKVVGPSERASERAANRTR